MNNDNKQIAIEIIEHSPSLVIRMAGEREKWRTLFITQNISQYGYNRNDFLQGKLTWIDVVHEDDTGWLMERLDYYANIGKDVYVTEYRVQKADGSTVWVQDATTVVRDADGVPLYSDCIISDYSQTKKNIERIQDNYRQQGVLNEILRSLHGADSDKALHIIFDRTGVYLDISRILLFKDSEDHQHCHAVYEWCNIGVPSLEENDALHLSIELVVPEIATDLKKDGMRIVNFGEIPPNSLSEFEKEKVVASAVFSVYVDDAHYGFICFDECCKKRVWAKDTINFLKHISKLVSPALIRKRNEQVIQDMAQTDQLTSLHNRYYLENRLNDAIQQGRKSGRSGFVLFIDMDDFKVINDGYGHDYGDMILKEFAVFLQTNFSHTAEIFRFGGDEFVILLVGENADNIYSVLDGLLARAQLPWKVMDKSFYCTLSIGIVRFPEAYGDGREIVKNADIAMYEAKKMGKNNYVFFTHTLNNDSVARAEIEKAMREAIDDNFSAFDTHYQPLVDYEGNIVGAEALMRWTLPDGRRVPPAEFIPLAEYLGLIVPLGEFILRAAAKVCKQINQVHPSFYISVNASIRQFQHSGFFDRIHSIMREEEVPLSNLVLEITESMAMQDIQRMRVLSEELRKLGVRISMDDFGTGYSSLGNMHELPIDVVKIDRSFITAVTTDAYAKSFIHLITDLVHSMRKRICIEGVETATQLKYCRECFADYVQGYYLGQPMPAAQLLSLCFGDSANCRAMFEEAERAAGINEANLHRGPSRVFVRSATRRFF